MPSPDHQGDARDLVDAFEASRDRLVGLGYRMLGDRTEAEDAVQDAWLRWSSSDRSSVREPEAFLVRTVTRLCLDRLKSARVRREEYVGPWLPEPVLDAERLTPGAATELAEDLSYALLLALERLTPTERAAFLLHDVFDAPYGEVAASLERSEAACRQLVSRARRAVRSQRGPDTRVEPDRHRQLLQRFTAAAATGDTAALEQLLAHDATLYSDGGAKVAAARNPIYGADKIVRFLMGLRRKDAEAGVAVEVREVALNGTPGLMLLRDGALDQAVTLEVRDERVQTLFFVRNPDKLESVREAL